VELGKRSVPKECKQYEYNHIYIPAQKYVPRYRRFLDVLRTVAPGGSTEFKIIAMWTSDLQCPLQKWILIRVLDGSRAWPIKWPPGASGSIDDPLVVATTAGSYVARPRVRDRFLTSNYNNVVTRTQGISLWQGWYKSLVWLHKRRKPRKVSISLSYQRLTDGRQLTSKFRNRCSEVSWWKLPNTYPTLKQIQQNVAEALDNYTPSKGK